MTNHDAEARDAELDLARAEVARLLARLAEVEGICDEARAVIAANPSWSGYLAVTEDAALRKWANELAAENVRLHQDHTKLGEDYVRIMTERDEAVAEGMRQGAVFDALNVVRLDLSEKVDELKAERDAMRPVVEAAQEWRTWWATLRPLFGMFIPENELAAAVDTWRQAKPGDTPGAADHDQGETPVHVYLSTACLHGEHDYCSATERSPGDLKDPGRCKFCPAPCVCRCHQDARQKGSPGVCTCPWNQNCDLCAL